MSTKIMGSAYRGVCPDCGETRSDLGPTAADVAIVRHRLENHMASIIETAWAQLDDQVDEIVNLTMHPLSVEPEQAIAQAKARARGKAEILALLMAPLYPTADAVAVEATRRHQARVEGRDSEARTPGDGELLAFESPRFLQAVEDLETFTPRSDRWNEALFVVTGGVAR